MVRMRTYAAEEHGTGKETSGGDGEVPVAGERACGAAESRGTEEGARDAEEGARGAGEDSVDAQAELRGVEESARRPQGGAHAAEEGACEVEEGSRDAEAELRGVEEGARGS